jgi:hypothetical protein
MQIANAIAAVVYAEQHAELVVTGAVEFGHSVTSLHQYGRACDYRTHHLPSKATAIAIADELRQRLGSDYDVVLESDHIHVEFDPKGTRLF